MAPITALVDKDLVKKEIYNRHIELKELFEPCTCTAK